MARLTRFVLPGHPQHVIQRGNNRNVIFFADEDYQFYIEKLGELSVKHKCELHAYVLMTNHAHLLITPQTENGISKLMQSMGRYYVQYVNDKYQRTGTLWEGRYKATLLDSESYLLTCYRYIELNPVRAGMVKHPADCRWSSYRYHALGETNKIITPHLLYQRLGKNKEERGYHYRQLFKSHIGKQQLNEIRSATNKAWVLGNEHFRKRIEELTKRPSQPKPRGGDRRSEHYQKSKFLNRV